MRQDIKLVMCSTEINKDGYIAKGMEVNFTLPASLSSQTYNMTEMEAKKGQGETREGRSISVFLGRRHVGREIVLIKGKLVPTPLPPSIFIYNMRSILPRQ